MKYVALLSGGKDSCFNLLHCHANGHELVAAASLHPPEGIDELDSYMYQSVGQDMIHLVADALEVPLYRAPIRGTPVEQALEYGPRSGKISAAVVGDETEDLMSLLQHVKFQHPDIAGVSAGAILSNYQRNRVEQVCSRLGLTVLSYLWQRSQTELLNEMIDSGLEAILIKVAGIGLSKQHLAQTLGQMQSHLLTLNEKYGSHACGEGGEYESLTLDCSLFKKRIVLADMTVITHSDNAFASVFYLRMRGRLDEKTGTNQSVSQLTIPPLLEDFAERIHQNISTYSYLRTPFILKAARHWDSISVSKLKISITSVGPWLCISNLHCIDRRNQSISQELDCLFQVVEEKLFAHGSSFEDIVYIHLLLASMDSFAEVNARYKTFFGTAPPARATVATDLPPQTQIVMEVLACKPGGQSQRRQSLHVQSLSYWAPANIGPYSQAISIANQTFLSGQIGLIPAHNELPAPQSIAMETALALQHTMRITRVIPSLTSTIQISLVIWTVDQNELGDIVSTWRQNDKTLAEQGLQVETCIFLLCRSLPKGAHIEVQSTFFSLPESPQRAVTMRQSDLSLSSADPSLSNNVSSYEDAPHCSVIFFNVTDGSTLTSVRRSLRLMLARQFLWCRLYFSASLAPGLDLLESVLGKDVNYSCIAVEGIMSRESKEYEFALSVHNDTPSYNSDNEDA